jgi:hypothetical protein
VCSADKPCDGPARRVTLTFTPDVGMAVRDVTTDRAGAYRILLRRGAYTVQANRGMSIRPRRVWVHGGVVATLAFAIDTGIR